MKCPHCEAKIVRFPIKDPAGKIIWQNLFKMTWQDFLLLLGILLIIFGWYQSTDDCRAILEDPCGICEDTTFYYEEDEEMPFDLKDLDLEPKEKG